MEFRIKSSQEFENGDKQFHFISVEWKIKSFAGKKKSIRSQELSKFIASPSFSSCGSGWMLSMFPNGEDWNGTDGKVVVYLVRQSFQLKLEYTVFSELVVHCVRGDKIFKAKHTLKGTRLRGIITNTLTTNDLLPKDAGYLLDDILTITCHFFIICSPENSESSSTDNLKGETPLEKKDANTNTMSKDFDALHLCDVLTTEKDDIIALSTDIEALYNSPRFADVILKLGENELPAHKLVLRSRSKVFEAMFEHDMQENRQDIVHLVDMDIDTVKDMLRYIYCGKTRQLSTGDALNLYVAADRYDLQGLVVKCRKIILSGLSVDNICEIAAVADLHKDLLLMDAVKSLLSKDMKEVFKRDKWMKFAKENPNLSLNLIQSVVLSS